MAFKHFRHTMTSTSAQTIYTVPSGREFVLLRTRARKGTASGTPGDIIFGNDEDAGFETITLGSTSSVQLGNTHKDLYASSRFIKVAGGSSGCIAEIMGLEFPTGTWQLINAPSESGGVADWTKPVYYVINTANQTSGAFNTAYYYSGEVNGYPCYKDSTEQYAMWYNGNYKIGGVGQIEGGGTTLDTRSSTTVRGSGASWTAGTTVFPYAVQVVSCPNSQEYIGIYTASGSISDQSPIYSDGNGHVMWYDGSTTGWKLGTGTVDNFSNSSNQVTSNRVQYGFPDGIYRTSGSSPYTVVGIVAEYSLPLQQAHSYVVRQTGEDPTSIYCGAYYYSGYQCNSKDVYVKDNTHMMFCYANSTWAVGTGSFTTSGFSITSPNAMGTVSNNIDDIWFVGTDISAVVLKTPKLKTYVYTVNVPGYDVLNGNYYDTGITYYNQPVYTNDTAFLYYNEYSAGNGSWCLNAAITKTVSTSNVVTFCQHTDPTQSLWLIVDSATATFDQQYVTTYGTSSTSGSGSLDSVTITYTADTQRSVVLDATEYTSYGETVYRGDSGQTYQGNTIYIWLYKGNVSGTQYWGATMSQTTPTFNGNDVYTNWYAYSTTLINSDYTEVTGMGWSDVSVGNGSEGSGGGNSGFDFTVTSCENNADFEGGYTYNSATGKYVHENGVTTGVFVSGVPNYFQFNDNKGYGFYRTYTLFSISDVSSIAGTNSNWEYYYDSTGYSRNASITVEF